MSCKLIIAIIGVTLISLDSWGQSSDSATARAPETRPASPAQNTSNQTGEEAQRPAQPVVAPAAGRRADPNSGQQSSSGAASTNPHEDSDLARIPNGAGTVTGTGNTPASTGEANQRIYLEEAFIQSGRRDGLIVPPPQSTGQEPWQERLFLDFRKVWKAGDRLNLTVSDRFNVRAENDISPPNHENVINDFREGFVSWQPHDGLYLDLGRINLRSGAALGFNPTDFFKSRAVVEPLSADPSVLREDRLGTFMLETQYIGRSRALTVAVAPALVASSPLYTDTALPSFNPSIDRTNDHYRILVKGSFSAGSDFNPELLYYREGSQNRFGVNLTRGIGQKEVVYAEWAAGEGRSLIDEALRYGRATGTLPANSPDALSDDSGDHLLNELSTGGSYTTSKKITFNLEYHLNQTGFSRHDWNSWFNIGRGQPGTSMITAELWYIRAYALDQQVSLSRHSSFLRADWVDAFVPNLEITGFVNTDLYDGSSLIQASADYYISRSWTFGAQVNGNAGSRHSDFGSLEQSVSALFKVARYF